MKILLTGSTGFLGGIIRHQLQKDYQIIGLSRTNAEIISDLSIQMPDLPLVDIVIHCAGKAHSVPKNDIEEKIFYDINVNGTTNLLAGLKEQNTLPKAFVFISSVAVYGLIEGENISENYPLLATDPYGKSKIEAEQMVQNWCAENYVICTILRLPLLVGVNPPGNLGAMIRGLRKGYYLNIAGGLARKSMVLASDVAACIPKVANIGGIYNLTDGYHPNFFELSNKINQQLGNKLILNIPLYIAKILGICGDFLGDKSPINTMKVKKITSTLTFDDSNAQNSFNWNPKLVISEIKVL